MQLMTRKNGGETPLQEVADACARYEDDADKHQLSRTYADFRTQINGVRHDMRYV